MQYLLHLVLVVLDTIIVVHLARHHLEKVDMFLVGGEVQGRQELMLLAVLAEVVMEEVLVLQTQVVEVEHKQQVVQEW